MMSADQPCVIEVPGGPSPRPGPDLPVIGDLPTTGGEDLGLLLLAIALVTAGVILARHRREGRTVAATLAVVALLGTGWGAFAPIPAQAAAQAPAESCSLIDIEGVERESGIENLLPGENDEALRYTVRNVTDFPVALTVSTRTDGSPLGAALTASVTGSPRGELAAGTLDRLPASTELVVDAGATLDVSYMVSLPLDAGNEVQTGSTVFDSIITATGPR